MSALTRQQRDRLTTAKARAKWVGEAHHAGMVIVIQSIADYRAKKLRVPRAGTGEYCEILRIAGSTTLDVLKRNGGHRAKSAQGRTDRDQSVVDCTDTNIASIESMLGATTSALIAPDASTEAEVTGEYENYLDAMELAVRESDGSVSSVESRLDAVLANAVAAGVPDGDLLALASFASVAVSSAYEWNAFDWSGTSEHNNETDNPDVYLGAGEESVTLKVIGVVTADAIGCLSTVKGWGAAWKLLRGIAWQVLAAECGFRGALASGGAIMALM